MGVVRRYIDIFPTPLVLALFGQQHPYFFVHFLMFFRSCNIIAIITCCRLLMCVCGQNHALRAIH